MSNSRLEFLENNYYHIYNRWFDKQIIFRDKQDYQKFYTYVLKFLEEFPSIKVVSYCLLPNHFHFVLKNIETGLDISKFMKKVQWSYVMYYKAKNKETGLVSRWPFFEWRFKAKHINTEQYLFQCLAYVNFNPLKHEIVKDIKDYPYTSYHQLKNRNKIENYKDILLEELEF